MNVAGRRRFSRDDLVRPGGPLSAEALAAVRSHPLLSEAVRAAAGALLAVTRKRPVVINDLGRLVIANIALYLHFSRDPSDPRSGLSANRLKALCVEQQVCSKGRALAVLTLMRRSGYLVPAPRGADRRVRRLVPTERLIGVCRQYWEALFRGMALVIPDPPDALTALQRENDFVAFVQVFGGYFRAGIRMFQVGADLTVFAQRNAGLAMLFSLLRASEPGATGAPVAVRISIAELARRFAVSRAQVLRVLDDAVAGALIERSEADDLQITVLPRLRSATDAFYVTAFSLGAHYMRMTKADVGGG
jgi:hypothetical protein